MFLIASFCCTRRETFSKLRLLKARDKDCDTDTVSLETTRLLYLPFVSRAMAPPAKRSEKGYGDENAEQRRSERPTLPPENRVGLITGYS